MSPTPIWIGYHNLVVFFVDINMFTDKQSSNKVVPTELDLTLGLAFRKWDGEFSVIYERDMVSSTLLFRYAMNLSSFENPLRSPNRQEDADLVSVLLPTQSLCYDEFRPQSVSRTGTVALEGRTR